MRKYITLFFSALAVLCSCGDDLPEGILDKKHMTDVLVDVHITDGTMVMVSSAADSMYKYGTAKYLAVFKNHGTDSLQFHKSFKYYAEHSEQLVEIYDEVTKKLQAKSDSLNKQYSKEMEKRNAEANKKNKPMQPDTSQRSKARRERLKQIKAATDTTKIKRNVLPK